MLSPRTARTARATLLGCACACALAASACSTSTASCGDAGVDGEFGALGGEAGIACMDQCRQILGAGVTITACSGPSSLPSGRVVVHCTGAYTTTCR